MSAYTKMAKVQYDDFYKEADEIESISNRNFSEIGSVKNSQDLLVPGIVI